MSDSGSPRDFCTSTYNPSIAADARNTQIDNQNLVFLLTALENTPSDMGLDQLQTPASQLYGTWSDLSLTPSALIYVLLNNDKTRVNIFRPMFETILVYSLAAVAELFHDADEPCERCREAVTCNTAVTMQIRYRLSLDMAESKYLGDAKECWQTIRLMMTLQDMTEKLGLNGHLDLDELLGNKAAVATCLCIAQILKSRKIDRTWLLGDFPLAESLVSRIASDHIFTSWPSLLDDDARTEEVSYYGGFGGRATKGEGDYREPIANCQECQGTQTHNSFHVEREEGTLQ